MVDVGYLSMAPLPNILQIHPRSSLKSSLASACFSTMFANFKSLLAVAIFVVSSLAAPAESELNTRAVSRKGYFKVIRIDPGHQQLGWLSNTPDGTGFRTTQDETKKLVISFTAPDNGTPFAVKTWNSAAPATPFLAWYPGYLGVDGSFSYAVLAGATTKNAVYTPPVEDPSGRGQRETTIWLINPTTNEVGPSYWINPDGSQAPAGQMYYSELNHIHLVGQMKGNVQKRVSDTSLYPIKFEFVPCSGC